MRAGVEVMTKAYEWETRLADSRQEKEKKKREEEREKKAVLKKKSFSFLWLLKITLLLQSSSSLWYFMLDWTRQEWKTDLGQIQKKEWRCFEGKEDVEMTTQHHSSVSCKEIARDFDARRGKSCKEKMKDEIAKEKRCWISLASPASSSSTSFMDDWMDDALRRHVKGRDRKEEAQCIPCIFFVLCFLFFFCHHFRPDSWISKRKGTGNHFSISSCIYSFSLGIFSFSVKECLFHCITSSVNYYSFLCSYETHVVLDSDSCCLWYEHYTVFILQNLTATYDVSESKDSCPSKKLISWECPSPHLFSFLLKLQLRVSSSFLLLLRVSNSSWVSPWDKHQIWKREVSLSFDSCDSCISFFDVHLFLSFQDLVFIDLFASLSDFWSWRESNIQVSPSVHLISFSGFTFFRDGIHSFNWSRGDDHGRGTQLGLKTQSFEVSTSSEIDKEYSHQEVIPWISSCYNPFIQQSGIKEMCLLWCKKRFMEMRSWSRRYFCSGINVGSLHLMLCIPCYALLQFLVLLDFFNTWESINLSFYFIICLSVFSSCPSEEDVPSDERKDALVFCSNKMRKE